MNASTTDACADGADRPAGALHPGTVGLRHELADTNGARGGEQVVGALGAQPVGGGRHPLICPKFHRSAERGELMDDHPRLGLGHASATESGCGASTMTGSAASARNAPVLAAERVVPTTSWPRAMGWGTNWLPIAPDAPAMKILMTCPFVVLSNNRRGAPAPHYRQ
jgi:hypothetical protein